MYVQYGCGYCAPAGWENFDASPTLRFERLLIVGRLYTRNAERFPPSVKYGDIVRGLPIADGSVDGLYASHVLEHLSYRDCRKALVNSMRVLRPGGTFRLVVPDLRARAERYLRSDSDRASHDFMETTYLGLPERRRGVGGILTTALGNSRHLWMWDERSMAAELSAVGFAAIRRCTVGDCDDPMFAAVESPDRFVDRGAPEVALQCVRPSEAR